LACCDVKNIGERRIWVPSPWHAFLFMYRNVRWACENNRNRPIYRGQANSKWPLIPALKRRENREEPAMVHRTILTRFCDSLKDMYVDDTLAVSNDECLAAAQHYGMKTNLLDFTSDPA